MSNTIVIVPAGTYPTGAQRVWPSVPVPATVEGFRLVFDCTEFTDPQTRIDISIDLSLDGGASWASSAWVPEHGPFPQARGFIGGRLESGVQVVGQPWDKLHNLLSEMGMQGDLPGVGNAQRRVSGLIKLSGPAGLTVATSMSLTTLP